MDYAIKKLEDYSRLKDIYRLTHDSLIERKYIEPQPDGQFNPWPHLDRSKQTTIFTVEDEESGRIIGTNSLSIDGPDGLNTDSLFKEETDRIRERSSSILGSSWRMATVPEYRSNRNLVISLIRETINTALDNKVETCLFVFQQRHVSVYKRLIGAEVVARKQTVLHGDKTVDMSLMEVNAPKIREKFYNSKFF